MKKPRPIVKTKRLLAAREVVGVLIGVTGAKVFAEIGVAKGATAIYLIERFDIDKYYLVDKKLNLARFNMVSEAAYSRFEFMSMMSIDASRLVPDNSLDGCFIDASHDEFNVRQDCRAWLPKVRPGGFLCGHDYAQPKWPGVKVAIDDFFEEGTVMLMPAVNCSIWIYPKP